MEERKEITLPKNVKQIGQDPGGQKIYIEDYVMTYLKQILQQEKEMKVSILYGHKEIVEDDMYWFVSGAIEAETDFFMQKTILDEDAWEKVNELAGRFFGDQIVLGWAISRPESTQPLQEQIIRTQKTFFRLDQKLYFEYITDENKESVFLFEKGKFKRQSGYYIYYDKNECMQNYMVSLRVAERHPEEFEADKAMKQIRENREAKKLQRSRRRTATLLTCFSMILVSAIMIIGITMLNNYEKMESMERVLYQISGKMDQSGTNNVAQMKEEQNVQDTLTVANLQYEEQGQQLADADEQQVVMKDENVISETQEEPESADAAPQEEQSEEETGEAAAEESVITDTEDKLSEDTPAEDKPSEDAPAEDSSDADGMPGEAESADGETAETISQNPEMAYVIQKGDTLAKICLHYYGNLSRMNEICEINHIENKDNIFYGQKIYLP